MRNWPFSIHVLKSWRWMLLHLFYLLYQPASRDSVCKWIAETAILPLNVVLTRYRPQYPKRSVKMSKQKRCVCSRANCLLKESFQKLLRNKAKFPAFPRACLLDRTNAPIGYLCGTIRMPFWLVNLLQVKFPGWLLFFFSKCSSKPFLVIKFN